MFIWRSVLETIVSIFQFTIFSFCFKCQRNSKSGLKNKPNPKHSSLMRNISSRSSVFMNNPKITNKYNHSSRRKCFGKERGFRSNYSETTVNCSCLDCMCAVMKSCCALMFFFSIHSTQTAPLSLLRLPRFPGCSLPFFKIAPAFLLPNSSSIQEQKANMTFEIRI